jgi:EAL domain-containing protein (putative c-di-GMP-specific phosphodiesterase class I)/signal transduction histidine kinase/CheY-like chemotaxis protein
MQRKGTIGRRLGFLALVSVAVAVLIGTAFSVTQETRRYVGTKSQTLIATAQVFAAAVADAAAAGDEQAALRSMRAIGEMQGVLTARIEGADGVVLASIGLGSSLDSDAKLSLTEQPSVWNVLASGTIETTVPIQHNGGLIGRFVIVAEANDLVQRLAVTLMITLIGALLAAGAGLAVARRLSWSLTRPITQLTEAMQQIRVRHDFTANVTVTSDDEVGTMVEGFNGLLGEIRTRDAKLAEHLQSLEKQVEDRTRDFREARDAAESANRAKSDFLAAMSHEIRTPMNGIMVMAELLAGSNLAERPQRHAEVIVRSGQSLLAIINDILDLSKIEAGQLTLEAIAFDPAEIVDQTVMLFSERARVKGLELSAYIDPAISGTVVGDPVRVHQVLSNLVNNALKFTEAGSVSINVDFVDGVEPKLRFAVSDTGIGIAPDKVNSLFSAFTQADQSITRKFGGTGLGLSICKKLADAMGATIQIDSLLGEGSTFLFTLPVSGLTKGLPWPRISGDALAVVALSGTHSADALSRYLSASGYRVQRHREAVDCSGLESGTIVFTSPALIEAANPEITIVACAPFGDPGVGSQAAGFVALDMPLQRGELAGLLARHIAGDSLIESEPSRAAGEARHNFGHLKILVVDDNEVNCEVALAALAHFGATADLAANGLEAVEAVTRQRYDIVLMDGSMPVMDGFAATRRIRANEARSGAERLPIVALTADVIGTAAEAWRDAGMDAILHKPFRVEDLGEILRRWAMHGTSPLQFDVDHASIPSAVAPSPALSSNASDASPLLSQEKLNEFASMAALGRPEFGRRILDLWREHAPQALASLDKARREDDLEGMGKAAHSLKSMSLNAGMPRVADLARAIETAARITATPPDEQTVQALQSALIATHEAIGVHLGEAVAAPGVGTAPDNGLFRAIEAGEIQPYFQPIVARGDLGLAGVEALARWVKPDGTVLAPSHFIQQAESSGLIVPLGSHILRQSMLHARSWPGINLSINVSPLQLQEDDFETVVADCLATTGFPTADLTLEITETAIIGNEQRVAEKLKRLRAKGVGIALDDFGTGYSSLAYLRRFPFSRIKIDKSFIDEVDTAMDAAAIVHAVVAIGRSLGLKIVAEGIETEAQLRFVTAAGVHFFQGYRFGRPMTAEALTELWRQKQVVHTGQSRAH